MKKLLALLSILAMLFCSACANNNDTAPNETTAFVPGEIIQADFVFTFSGTDYGLGTEAAPLIASIESAYNAQMDVIEANSCMFAGMDREYSNDDLVLATYPYGTDGADMLETVMVFSSEYPSARGICVGAERSLVEEAYGTNYTYDYNQMFYSMNSAENSPMIVFTLENDVVTDYYIFLNTGV